MNVAFAHQSISLKHALNHRPAKTLPGLLPGRAVALPSLDELDEPLLVRVVGARVRRGPRRPVLAVDGGKRRPGSDDLIFREQSLHRSL